MLLNDMQHNFQFVCRSFECYDYEMMERVYNSSVKNNRIKLKKYFVDRLLQENIYRTEWLPKSKEFLKEKENIKKRILNEIYILSKAYRDSYFSKHNIDNISRKYINDYVLFGYDTSEDDIFLRESFKEGYLEALTPKLLDFYIKNISKEDLQQEFFFAFHVINKNVPSLFLNKHNLYSSSKDKIYAKAMLLYISLYCTYTIKFNGKNYRTDIGKLNIYKGY